MYKLTNKISSIFLSSLFVSFNVGAASDIKEVYRDNTNEEKDFFSLSGKLEEVISEIKLSNYIPEQIVNDDEYLDLYDYNKSYDKSAYSKCHDKTHSKGGVEGGAAGAKASGSYSKSYSKSDNCPKEYSKSEYSKSEYSKSEYSR